VQTARLSSPRYLIAHACFVCRKSFKVAPRGDSSAVCPACGSALFLMGRSFRTPPMDNVDQWAKVEALYKAGFRFFSYRSVDGPPLPARLADVDAFIRDNPTHPLRVAVPNDSFKATPNGAPQLKR
jgi:DNA-directed RNA polymerase subunit RPC12/RpoP